MKQCNNYNFLWYNVTYVGEKYLKAMITNFVKMNYKSTFKTSQALRHIRIWIYRTLPDQHYLMVLNHRWHEKQMTEERCQVNWIS